MDDYKRKVRRLALERTGEAFYNASEEHAAIIVENVFATACHEVCILTRHLAPRIYARESCVNWAGIFLADNDAHRMRIVMREGDLTVLPPNPLFASVRSLRNVEFRVMEDTYFDTIPYRFLVADRESYRFEPDHTKCSAVAAFGAPDESRHLQEIFESFWTYARPVNLDNLEAMHPDLVQ